MGRIALAAVLLAPAWAQVSFDLSDADGVRRTSAALKEHKAAVFLFLGTHCPLSNRYAPEIGRIQDEYANRGVAFHAVYSDPAARAAAVKAHTKEYGLRLPALLDHEQTLARRAGATVTPQAVLTAADGTILYRGRIDDRAVALGKMRLQPTTQDLRRALDQALAGEPVTPAATKAVGCAIPFARTVTSHSVTFTEDIAPILYRRCAECHRPGEVAPFPLLAYGDAAPRASLIAAVTEDRLMPPWKPVAGHGQFQGERRLTDSEISLLRQWASAGAPEGDPADLPPHPEFPKDWRLGPPDLIVKMAEPFPIPAGGPDVYQCFVVPLGGASDRWVRALEFRPGNRNTVHHALLFTDARTAARQLDRDDPAPGYQCFGAPGFLPTVSLGGWSPGNEAIEMPSETALKLHRGANLVIQVHYHPTGKPESDRSQVGFYFSDTPPSKKLLDIPLGSRMIDIPAGESAYRVTDHFTLPIDVWAVGIIPHAHYLCRRMLGVAVSPEENRRPLIRIDDWDFNWQEQYRYKEPFLLKAGTRLEMEFQYDNSEQNPRNPSSPPQRVLWGPGTTDEMAGLHLQVIPADMSEMGELTQALWGKLMRMVGGSFYRLPDKK